MARKILTDVRVSIGGVDLSDHIASVEVASEREEIEITAFGDTARRRVAGLEDSSISLDFHQDWAAASVDATIAPLVGSTAAFEIFPDGTALSATNPKYTGNVLITEWGGLNGAIGELATVSVTWPVDGVLTRATA
jgi:hypothetical protein